MKKTTTPTKPPREPRIDIWVCYQCYRPQEGRRSKHKVCEFCGYPSKGIT